MTQLRHIVMYIGDTRFRLQYIAHYYFTKLILDPLNTL